MPESREVLCVLPLEFGLAQSIYQGVQAYASDRSSGLRFHSALVKDDVVELVQEKLVCGLICFGGNRGLLEEPALRGFPMINVSASREASPVPMVVNDDARAGFLSAVHLAKTHPSVVVFVSPPKGNHYRLRMEGARSVCAKAGVPFVAYTLPHGDSGRFFRRNKYLQEVLDKHAQDILTTGGTYPLAVVCADYRIAELIVLKARELKLDVPADVRVVGIGNPTDRFSFLRQDGISYLPLDWERVGYRSAESLERWITEDRRPVQRMTIPPGELVIEHSSRAPTDSVVEQSRLLVTEKADYGLTVEEIAGRIGISVGTLISRFRQECDHTPKEMLIRWRMEFACELLKNTHEEVASIAAKCGYADHSTFTTAFRKFTGESPSRWRTQL